MSRFYGSAVVRLLAVTALVAGCMALCECGGNKEAQPVSLPDLLAERFPGTNLARIDDVRTFSGDALWEYINGDAEIYHKYGFEDVATADYRGQGIEMVVDVYRFVNDIGAYGLYTTIRPLEPDIRGYGIEGFASETSVNFVKGPFVVRLTGFTSSESTTAVLAAVAGALDTKLPGATQRPGQFEAFPADSQVPFSDRIHSSSFLGQEFLAEFFTQDYARDGDTVTLFYTGTGAASKFEQWRAQPMGAPEPAVPLSGVPFDEGRAFVIPDTYYGAIAVGLKGSRLVGMINYSAKHDKFLAGWLTSMPR